MDLLALTKQFTERYGVEPLIARAPGRVNLIGEHTDYNDGFVLPAAIDKAIYVAIQKRNDNNISLYSNEFEQLFETHLTTLKPSSLRWPNYILGVVAQLINKSDSLNGFNLILTGNIPIGAGLSSSAAVECATIFALNELFQLQIPKIEMVKMAQKAEHEFAGVQCGIMDQFASIFGKKEHVIKLDCRSLEYKYEPFHLEKIKILLLNTNVKHSLASSEYNTRRKECERGVLLINTHHKEIKSLRDATPDMLNRYVAAEPTVYKRCKYIIEENERLQAACIDLEQGNLQAFGKKMFATHYGLSKLYEVSCPELDFLVEQVQNKPGVLGARMMGGGFGGCTINLVQENAIDKLVPELTQAYEQQMNKPLTAYIAQIENGASIVKALHKSAMQ